MTAVRLHASSAQQHACERQAWGVSSAAEMSHRPPQPPPSAYHHAPRPRLDVVIYRQPMVWARRLHERMGHRRRRRQRRQHSLPLRTRKLTATHASFTLRLGYERQVAGLCGLPHAALAGSVGGHVLSSPHCFPLSSSARASSITLSSGLRDVCAYISHPACRRGGAAAAAAPQGRGSCLLSLRPGSGSLGRCSEVEL